MNKRFLWYRMVEYLPLVGSVIAILLVVALFLIGIITAINNTPVLAEGTVTDMSFDAAKTELTFYTTADGDGNVTTHSRPVHYPNKWSIQVVGARENGEPRSEWWDVGEGMYGQIGIGDTVHRDMKLNVVRIVRKAVAEDAAKNR